METDQPGREIPKEYREVVRYLIRTEGWAYQLAQGGGYPKLFPANRAYAPIRVPKTPSSQRTYSNWLAETRRSGGHWPPDTRR